MSDTTAPTGNERVHEWLPLVLTRRVGSTDYGYALRPAIVTAVLPAAPFMLYALHRRSTTLGEAARRWGSGRQ